MHVSDFLKEPNKHSTGPIVVLFGTVRYLKQQAVNALKHQLLGEDADDELGFCPFAGKETDIKTIRDELSTVSMWGDSRIILVEEADSFVTDYRKGLEKYLEQPAKKSLLVLVVNKWLKTTRLAKAVAKIGLPLECSDLKGAALSRWITETAATTYEKKISRDASALLTELAGSDLGLLSQELAKLADFTGDNDRITPEDVKSLVGGWKVQTTWEMLDALRAGDINFALKSLEKLLVAGEAPQKIFGGITFQYRKIAEATELSRAGMPLNGALKQAGVFFRDIDATAHYMKRIGRPQATKIIQQLAITDGHLKGTGYLNERIELEELLLMLSGVSKG
ncbi:hypothetical protein MNBD_PLANCTO02-1396 [hydrothermal vent metagenome]|uniref:DNA polymerase III subunit delta n=1 Tax=hydrothermal vent metagenome TaxID=652676 RepID=A0A3B1DRJ2_9ZZZZ